LLGRFCTFNLSLFVFHFSLIPIVSLLHLLSPHTQKIPCRWQGIFMLSIYTSISNFASSKEPPC
jgi:hypothetical protein